MEFLLEPVMDIQIVSSAKEGIRLAKEFLYKTLDRKTVLFVSGGKTPYPLFCELVKEKKFVSGAVGLVDERFGESLHKDSNERLLQKTGFLEYLLESRIPFYPILYKGLSLEKAATAYDITVRFLLNHFPKSVGVMGIGEDGHTAGILLNAKEEPRKLVSAVLDGSQAYPKRITMTFSSLALIDILVVLAFGESKRKALIDMHTEGSIAEFPARFYCQRGIAEKTILITDQKI